MCVGVGSIRVDRSRLLSGVRVEVRVGVRVGVRVRMGVRVRVRVRVGVGVHAGVVEGKCSVWRDSVVPVVDGLRKCCSGGL